MAKQDTRTESKQLEALERKFCAFLQDVSLKHEWEKPHVHINRTYGRNFAFLQWGDETLNNAIAATRRLCPSISDKLITKALRDLMIEIFESQTVSENADPKADADLESIAEILDTSNVKQELVEVILRLRIQARPQIVFVPIEGLHLKTSELAVGSVVLHHRHDKSELDCALRSLEDRIGKQSASSVWADLKDVGCYATMETVGDDHFVRDEALQRTTEAIHILNLYLSSSRHQPHWAKIRIARVIINQTLPTEDSEGGAIGFNQSFPVERQLELDWKKERYIIEWGLNELSTCFQPQNENEIAKRIRRAVTWYSKAVDADSPGEKFVNLAIALESLLIGDEGKGPYATTGSIRQTLGERVAFLLGDDFESRTRIEGTTKNLYGLRSAIVHRGKQITQDQLAEMDNLVIQVTLAFLKRNFASWFEFQEWVLRQRYKS